MITGNIFSVKDGIEISYVNEGWLISHPSFGMEDILLLEHISNVNPSYMGFIAVISGIGKEESCAVLR